MSLSDLWNLYTEGNYKQALENSVVSLSSSAGIDLLHIAGLSLMNMRRHQEGIVLLKAATTFRPQSPHIYVNAAYIAEQSNMPDEAFYFSTLGLEDFPNNFDLLLLKANSLVVQLKFDEAAIIYEGLLKQNPNFVQAIINLGNIARSNDDFDTAQALFDRAAALEPNHHDLVFARATMHTQKGENDKSIALLEPISDNVDARFLLSLLYLTNKDYQRGFEYYKSRAKSIWFKTSNYAVPVKPCDSLAEAVGKDIAIIPEGGFGDLIQFFRYVPMLSSYARQITLLVPKELERLFHSLPSNVKIILSSDLLTVDDFDYVITFVDLPYLFRTTYETIPNKLPYLPVTESALTARRLPETTKKRVGLCWAGGGRDSLNSRSYDPRRSISLSMLMPLSHIKGIEFVSLQMGDPANQTGIELLKPLTPDCDFLDTAAIVAQLDLVITVDTSVVHLAGAMNKPTWLLSRYDACWRWHHNENDNPWYLGTLRIFGQKSYKDWSQPIDEITNALKEWVNV